MMKTVYIITSPSWNEDFIDALSFYYLSNQNGNLTLLNKDKEFVKDGFLNEEEVVKYFESTVDYIEDCLIFNDDRLDQETVVNNLIDILETGSYSSGDFWLTFINEVCDDSYSESFDSVLGDYECKYVLNEKWYYYDDNDGLSGPYDDFPNKDFYDAVQENMNQPLVNGKATKTDYIDSFDVVKKEGYIIAIDKHSPSLKFYFFNIHYCYYYGYVGICHECNLMIGYADYKDDLIEILEKQYSNDFCFPFLDDTKENPIESYQSCFASEFSTYKELNGVWKEIFNKADLSPCASNKTTKLYLINNQLFQLRNNKLRLLPRRNLASLKEEYPNISEELFQMEKKKNPRIHFKERLALSQ